jgi:hypothetical protein
MIYNVEHDGKMIVNGESERMWEEAVANCSKEGETGESYEIVVHTHLPIRMKIKCLVIFKINYFRTASYFIINY